LPKFVQMQFESHVMLESDSIPLGKNFKLARMREGGGIQPAVLTVEMGSRLRGNDATVSSPQLAVPAIPRAKAGLH
jgi:hypothetical protein